MDSIAKDEAVGKKKGSRIAERVQKYEGLSSTEKKEADVSIARSRPDIARVVASKKDSRLSLEIEGAALSSSSLQFVMGLVNRKLDPDDEEALRGFVEKLDSPRLRKDSPTTEEERQKIADDAKGKEVVSAFVERIVQDNHNNLLLVLERLIERYRRCVRAGSPNWLLRIVECSLDPYVKKWNVSTPRERKVVVEEFGDKAKALEIISSGFAKSKAAELVEGLGREEYELWSPCETCRITKLGSALY